MADKKHGVLRRVVANKGFGFIKFENREIFVHKSNYPGQMIEGAKVSFEESEPNPDKDGRTEAINVEVLEQDPAAPVPVRAIPPASRPTASPPENLAVSVRFGIILIMGGKKFLPVMVEVKKAGSILPDKAVELLKNDKKAAKPSIVNTKADGIATFMVQVEDTEEVAIFAAKVGSGVYTEIWKKAPVVDANATETKELSPTAKPQEPTDPAEGPKVKRLHMVSGVYTFEVEDLPNTDIVIDSTVPVLTRNLPCLGDEGWGDHQYKTSDSGRLQLQVKVKTDDGRGDVFFCNHKFRSVPQYVYASRR
jgi:cold shock CspA family protein